jgi:hypothetical protein
MRISKHKWLEKRMDIAVRHLPLTKTNCAARLFAAHASAWMLNASPSRSLPSLVPVCMHRYISAISTFLALAQARICRLQVHATLQTSVSVILTACLRSSSQEERIVYCALPKGYHGANGRVRARFVSQESTLVNAIKRTQRIRLSTD